MNLKKIKFAKKGATYLRESKQSLATCFRHYINLAQPSGFSDIDTSAYPEEYTPLLFSNRKDLRGNELYEDDVIFIEIPDIFDIGKSVWKLCIVGYNEVAAAFGVYDLSPEFENLEFTAFNQLPLDVSAFLLGSLHTDKEFIDKMLAELDNGAHPGMVIEAIYVHQKIRKRL